MKKDNYGDIYLSEMCWERQAVGLAVLSPTHCQKYVKRRAQSQVLLTAGVTLEPGLEGPPGGCLGHSPLNSEALNTGGVDLSHMAPSSHGRLEKRCEEQEAFV